MLDRDAFWARVVRGPDCWQWAGDFDHDGNAMLDGMLARDVSWMIHNGPIPVIERTHLRCGDKACTNPAHIFVGR